jgi:branched-chain amino acid transport system substrate-binding protein
MYLPVTALLLAGTMTACGDKAAETATSPALTKSEIKIGLLISETGSSSSSDKGGSNAANAWAQWVNANGGLSGHPVKVVIKDDRGDGATAVAAAKELVADPSVLAITSQTSNTETAVSAYLKDQDIPVVGATGYNPAIWGALPNYFSTVPAGFPTAVLAQFVSAKAVGATKWSAVYCSEVASCKNAEPLYTPAAAQQGLTYNGSVAVAGDAASYTAECLKLKQAGTDFIQLGVSPAVGKRVIADCKAQGYTGWFGATAGAVNAELTKISGVRLAGGLQGFPWWANHAKAQQFRDAMKQYEPDADYQDPGTTAVWGALELLHKALATVGDSPTRQDVFTGLYGLNNEDLGGLLPLKMTYTKGAGAPKVLCIWLYRLEGGKFSSAALSGPSGNSVATGDLKTDCVQPLS